MITQDIIRAITKEDLTNILPTLSADDIRQCVAWLEEKDDDIRYKSFLILQQCSEQENAIYPYWDIFVGKFGSLNSYQRSIGLMLIAENARWDTAGKLEAIFDTYLTFCDDEKPVTVRQCIQSLCKIVPYKKGLYDKIVHKLASIDLMQRKETQRKLLLLDILSVFLLIRKEGSNDLIEGYIRNALSGALLDAKSKKMIQTQL